MKKLICIMAILLLAVPVWSQEKKAEVKEQTVKIVVDMPEQAEKQKGSVQTKKKVKTNPSDGARANRLKR